MKLSKEILYNAFIAASNIVKPHGDWFNLMRNAAEALDDGTLEIEGYVREDHIANISKKVEEWIRFDPEDKKTFPKKYPVLVHLDYGGIEICTLFFDGKFQTGVVDSFAPEKITHWRPLPPPPGKEEAK